MKKCFLVIWLLSNALLLAQSIQVLTPNGGERYQQGQSYNITWTSSGVANVRIEYTNDGVNWVDVIASTTAATGTYPFNFSTVTTGVNCLIRISDTVPLGPSDESDNVFSVVNLQLTSPNGAEHLQVGKVHNITWSSEQISNVKLEYSTNNGTNWTTIVTSLGAAPATYAWTVPNLPSTTCKVRVSDVTNSLITDVSDAVFTISNLVLTSPNGGENFLRSSTHAITWISQNVANVKIEYSSTGAAPFTEIVNSTNAATGSYNWTVPAGAALTANYKIKITDADAAFVNVNDESNNTFTISNLTLGALAGLPWQGGTVHSIEWSSDNITNVKLEYSTDNGSNWIVIENSIATASNPQSYSWTVPNTPSTQCKIRISDLSYPSSSVTSNAFTIEPVASITVTSPNGSENWQESSVHNITWNATTNIANVNITYSINGGSSWTTVASGIAANLGTYSWTVPNNPSQNCVVKVTSAADVLVNDVSNSAFTISALNLTSPNGTERFQNGKNYNITWTSINISNVKLEYTTDNGTAWTTIAPSIVASLGTYAWTVPNTPSVNCKIRVSDASNGSINDVSTNPFTIASLTLTSPNGGEDWIEGSTHTVTWNSTYIANVRLEYSVNSGTTWNDVVATTPSDGSYDWTVPNTSASTYSFRISDAATPAIYDISDNLFTVSKINLTSPVGTEDWKVGTAHNITWTGSATIANVKLEYTTNNGTSWITIASSVVASLGTYSWIVPNTTSTACKVRISNVTSPEVNSVSPAIFAISKSLNITSPNGGETWEVGALENITWTNDPVINYVRIQYTHDNGSNWIDINNYVDADLGTYAWTIPNFPSTDCLIRISDVDNVTNIDTSDVKFSIRTTPTITVTSPNGGESFENGALENITWTSNNVINVKIEFTSNNGSTWNLVSASQPSTGSYAWDVPNVNSDQCKIKITDASNSNVFDISNNVFTIVPRITIVSPNGGESIAIGSTQAITWSSANVTNMKITYSTNDGTSWNEIVASTPAAAGTYNWAVPNTASTACIIKVSDRDKPEVYDVSNSVFTIYNKIKVLDPNGGESYQVGTNCTIQWESTDVDDVSLYYSSNNGAGWNAIVTPVDASLGSYDWTVPTTTGNQYKIKVSEAGQPNIFDISDQTFSVSSLNLLNPNGSENFAIGSTLTIEWTSIYVSNVKIQYSIDNGLNWISIKDTAQSNGIYYWQVPNTPSTQCKVKISDVSNPSTYDVSSSVFSITESPTVQVLYPKGGESLGIGNSEIIRWTSSNVNYVKLEYSVNGGTSWSIISTSVQSIGTYAWTVPNSPSNNCKIRISDTSRPGIQDASDSVFVITTAPKITVLYPNGGENISAGSQYNIKWTSASVSNVKLEYSANNGVDWTVIEGSYPSSGSYIWTVPDTASNLCKVRISDASNSAILDESNSVFIIASSPFITITSPNGNEEWEIGKTKEIKWSSTNTGNVKIEYSINNGNTWSTIAATVKSTGSYNWSVPNTPSEQCKIKISDVLKSTVYDISDSVFTILYSPKITVVAPNGNEQLKVGSYSNITWTSTNVSNVKIEYSVNNGVDWSTIVENTPSTGLYVWHVVNETSYQCRIRITDILNQEIADISDNAFSITESPSITILSPNGRENFSIGKSELIKWTSINVNNVKIEYSVNNGNNWSVIAASVVSTGSYSWTVPNVSSNSCKIKITDTYRADVLDVSDSVFTITSLPKISLLSPNGGDTLKNNSTYLIKWSSSNVGNVKIEYSPNNGVDWNIIEESYPSTGVYSWIVPNSPTSLCKIRISDASDSLTFDESDKIFMIISSPFINVNSPNGNENWEIGKSYIISWTSNNVDKVKIEYSVNNGNTWTIITSSTLSTGSYLWTVPSSPSVQAKIKITDISKSTNFDVSDSLFSIVFSPKISITKPTANEVLKVDSYYNITWTSNNVGDVKIEYSVNNGVSWSTITESTSSTGLYIWQVANTPSYQCKIRISDVTDPQIVDISADPFTIAYIDLITPADGESVLTNSAYIITWKTEGIINVKLEYSINDGVNWTVIASSVDANKGSYKWNVPLAVIQSCRIRVSDVSKPTVLDMNENGFAVKQIIVTSPAENAKWPVGTTQLVQWQTYSVAKVNIEYSTDNGFNWDTLAVNVPSSVGIYYWIIPNSPSENCLVRVSDASNVANFGTNRKYFTIGEITGIDEDEAVMPDSYELEQNYPNPFNPETTIGYKIPRDNFVVLKIYDLLGNEISTLVNENKRAGTYKLKFDGASLPSGIYIYTIRTAGFRAAKKLMLIK